MSIQSLFARYRFLERELQRAIVEDASNEERAGLLRLIADLLDVLEDYPPADAQEAKDKAYFFLLRGLRKERLRIDNRDLDVAMALSEPARRRTRTKAGLSVETANPPGAADHPGIGLFNIGDLISFVTESSASMFLLDDKHRYVAVSARHAESHRTRPVRMIGESVYSMVPDSYREMATRRIELALAGVPQEFLYKRETADGAAILRYEIQNCRLREGARAVIGLICDVSDDKAIREVRIPIGKSSDDPAPDQT